MVIIHVVDMLMMGCLCKIPAFSEVSDGWFVACHFAKTLKLTGALASSF